MASSIYTKLVKNKVQSFKVNFSDQTRDLFWDAKSNRLIHAGEYGRYRENLTSELLRQFTPKYIEYSTGFVVSPKDKVSTQCDLILHDRDFTPAVTDNGLNYFFPVDSIFGVGEVKSDINSLSELKGVLEKLSKIKNFSLDRSLESSPTDGRDFNRNSECNDIFTFLICNKLKFNLGNLGADIERCYSECGIDVRYRHNLIYSVSDGLVLYKDINDTLCSYPILNNEKTNVEYRSASDENDVVFLSQIYTSLSFVQRVCIDLLNYLR